MNIYKYSFYKFYSFFRLINKGNSIPQVSAVGALTLLITVLVLSIIVNINKGLFFDISVRKIIVCAVFGCIGLINCYYFLVGHKYKNIIDEAKDKFKKTDEFTYFISLITIIIILFWFAIRSRNYLTSDFENNPIIQGQGIPRM